MLAIDPTKAARLLFEFDPAIYQASSTGGPPGAKPPPQDPAISSLASKAQEDRVPDGVSIDTPDAHYIKDLLEAAGVKPTYPTGDPDRYLLVDMAFALRQFRAAEFKEYESALLQIFTRGLNEKTFAHALLPVGIADAAGIATLIYVVQSNGIVRAANNSAGRGWRREYTKVVPVISSGGSGPSATEPTASRPRAAECPSRAGCHWIPRRPSPQFPADA